MAVSRKTVTVLFADVADSTGLGERLDPESVRDALSRWFEVARAVLERHGGTVEKFIGDAVMAVFGIPQVHEDDALRAVRAADGLRTALARLNDELEGERGLRLVIRVGVNTGEVVAGDGGGTLVTGDAVNTAKRLEEAASNGDVVVGEATRVLARAAASFEQLEPLAAKGKSERVRAWRLIGIDARHPGFERRADTPLVGRKDELERLRQAYAHAVRERTCCLFTLLGPAGIGKTRLASEFYDELSEHATVVVGRCLPYGDGITFWPLTEILQELGGERRIAQLVADAPDADLILERLRGSPDGAGADSQETFWAVRKVCEALAHERPLVVCFEDVHWAEPTFLDLIEYLAGWIRDTPMLLLCLARPELIDDRPSWLARQEHAVSLTLSPLRPSESEELLDAHGIFGRARARIAEAAEGNPLYAQQMAAMVIEGGYEEGLFSIPPTIQALLAARLDRLSPADRSVIERAAICGKEFWRDAIVELSPVHEHAAVGAALMSLVRKELVHPHRSTARSDDAFRFVHVLIRDAAYGGIPKETRADLHEHFAGWLRSNAGEHVLELEEIVGYHLEQAFQYRQELGPPDDRTRRLASEAGALLAPAGRRAIARDDAPAAVKLLDRAAHLLEGHADASVLTDLGAALTAVGELSRAGEVLTRAIERARAQSDRSLEASALIERAIVSIHTDGSTDELERVAAHVIPMYEQAGDDAGLARAWHLVSVKHFAHCEFGAMDRALAKAIDHARKAGDSRQEWRALGARALAVLLGPTSVIDAIDVCSEIRERTAANPSLQAFATGQLAELEAMRGRFDEARRFCAEAKAVLAEHGRTVGLAGIALHSAPVELLAGRPDTAERELRWAYDVLRAVEARSSLSTVTAFLTCALALQGKVEEAERFAEQCRTSTTADDVLTQVVWRNGLAHALAAKGDPARAAMVAREAVGLARSTDSPNLLADALVALSVSMTPGSGEWADALQEAMGLYEAKGNLVSAARMRDLVEPAAVTP
jgi:class 3 adenylate cyclase/tetratricopeptide (TPR) repeat protein